MLKNAAVCLSLQILVILAPQKNYIHSSSDRKRTYLQHEHYLAILWHFCSLAPLYETPDLLTYLITYFHLFQKRTCGSGFSQAGFPIPYTNSIKAVK